MSKAKRTGDGILTLVTKLPPPLGNLRKSYEFPIRITPLFKIENTFANFVNRISALPRYEVRINHEQNIQEQGAEKKRIYQEPLRIRRASNVFFNLMFFRLNQENCIFQH